MIKQVLFILTLIINIIANSLLLNQKSSQVQTTSGTCQHDQSIN